MKENRIIVHALIKVGDKFLVTKRSEIEDTYPGYWDIPGGLAEKGELPKDAVIRETKEETNLDITPIKIIREDSNLDKEKDIVFIRLIYFAELSNIDNINLNIEEHTDYKLIKTIDDLNEKTFDFIIDLIKKFK